MDLRQQVLELMAAHFDATVAPGLLADYSLTLAPTYPGWPDWSTMTGRQYEGRPLITVSASPKADIQWCAPSTYAKLDVTGDSTQVDVVWAIGMMNVKVQVDTWAAMDAQLDALDGVLQRDGMHNRLPFTTGLVLPMPDNYGSMAVVHRLSSVAHVASGASQSRAEHRSTWAMEVYVKVLAVGRTPRQAVLSVTSELVSGDLEVASTTFEVP